VNENSILNAKINFPSPLSNSLPRPRLRKLLENGQSHKLVLVSAPAGFGKTTLVSDWAAAQESRFAWFSIDTYDNDPVVFFGHFFQALSGKIPHVDPSWFSMLPQHSKTQGIMYGKYAVQSLEEYDRDVIMVLDDYHLIENQIIHENINYLLAYSPNTFHLVILTRADPPLKLSRLRIASDIQELRAVDLRLTNAECAQFLKNHNPAFAALTREQITHLNRRLEGWAAGLQLAAISLVEKEDQDQYLKNFSGTEKFIIDYFMEEVLANIEPDLREFLIYTSILESFSPQLANAVCAIANSKDHIQQLREQNMFIFPIDKWQDWFRYHQLFRDLLKIRLNQLDQTLMKQLHTRAASWLEENGFIERSVHHWITAKEFQHAVDHICSIAETLIKTSRFITLEQWVQHIPKEFLHDAAGLRLDLLWTKMIRDYDHAHILAELSKINQIEPNAVGKADAFRSFIYLSEGNFERSGKYAHAALKNLTNHQDYFYQTALWCAGIVSIVHTNLDQAVEILEELRDISLKSDNKMLAVLASCQTAKARHRQGRLKMAEQKFLQALQTASDTSNHILPIASEALMGLGDLYREMDDLEKAQDYILDGIEYAYQWRDVSAIEGYLTLAKIRLAQSDFSETHHALDKAWKLAEKYNVIEFDNQLVRTQRAKTFFAQGQYEKVHRWADQAGYLDLDPKNIKDEKRFQNILLSREFLFFSRYLLHINEPDRAIDWIDILINQFNPIHKLDVLIELQAYRAYAHHLLGKEELALQDISHLLHLAQPTEFRRLFIDLGEDVLRVLQSYKNKGFQSLSLDRFFNISRKSPNITSQMEANQLLEPLSEREINVLKYLRTNLTTPEIASEMMISVNTVRTHIKNIYQKLGVHRRSAAVRVARANQLFPTK